MSYRAHAKHFSREKPSLTSSGDRRLDDTTEPLVIWVIPNKGSPRQKPVFLEKPHILTSEDASRFLRRIALISSAVPCAFSIFGSFWLVLKCASTLNGGICKAEIIITITTCKTPYTEQLSASFNTILHLCFAWISSSPIANIPDILPALHGLFWPCGITWVY